MTGLGGDGPVSGDKTIAVSAARITAYPDYDSNSLFLQNDQRIKRNEID